MLNLAADELFSQNVSRFCLNFFFLALDIFFLLSLGFYMTCLLIAQAYSN